MHLDDKTLDFKPDITGGDWVSRTGVRLPCRWEGMRIVVRGQADAGMWIVLMTPVCHVTPSKPFGGTFPYCLCTGPLGLQQICHRGLKRHLQVSVPSLACLQSPMTNAGAGLRTSPGFPAEGTRAKSCQPRPSYTSQAPASSRQTHE